MAEYVSSLSQKWVWWGLNVVVCAAFFALALALPETQNKDISHSPKLSQAITSLASIQLSNYELPPVPSNGAAPPESSSDALYGSLTKEIQSVATATANAQALSNVDLRIRLPKDKSSQAKIGRFLYDCVGIGFGAVDDISAEADIEMLHEIQSRPSQIVRRISDILFENEQHMSVLYANNRMLVRIYPQWIDTHLVSKINAHLYQSTLRQFSGTYKLSANQLLLENITLNEAQLDVEWLLADGNRIGC